jgi:hypothetical protein
VEVSAPAEAEEVTHSGASGSGRDGQRRRPLFGERVAGKRLREEGKGWTTGVGYSDEQP